VPWNDKSEVIIKPIKNDQSLAKLRDSPQNKTRLFDKSQFIPPPMPLLPWSLVPSEPIRSGSGIQFLKLWELKSKVDSEVEEVGT